MCGIIGYLGSRRASPILLEGLKQLEYRGYDSCGIACAHEGISLRKNIGKVADVAEKEGFASMEGTLGIAHTRWATHGKVTKENAHPHLSNNSRIAVVHNGIIENYQELREFLSGKGFRFFSETDTEVIPNLIEYEMRDSPFEDACKRALKRIEGSYAVLAISRDNGNMVAARHNSPLVIGIGEGEYFAASDIPAFIRHTKKVMYLHDFDFIVLGDSISSFNLHEMQEVKRDIKRVDWDVEQAQKGNFEHFMMKEISEQVETLQKALHQNKDITDRIVSRIRDASEIFIVACGSSYHAGLTASYLFSEIAKKQATAVVASEFPNFSHFITDRTVVLAISQSGETADVLDAVKDAKRNGAGIVSIVNVFGSSLTQNSDEFLLLNAGPEVCVLSTKTYTSQLALLSLLAYSLAGEYGLAKEKINYLVNSVYLLTSENVRNRIQELAERIKGKEHMFLIGRGLQYPTSMEAALKIKEVSYIHAEAFAGGELKHGTIALIEEGTPCIVFCSEKNEREILSNAIELKSRGAYIIGVSARDNSIFDFFIKVPEANSLSPIMQIIPIQILAYQLAILRGCDPDKPRNLAKSVTVK